VNDKPNIPEGPIMIEQALELAKWVRIHTKQQIAEAARKERTMNEQPIVIDRLHWFARFTLWHIGIALDWYWLAYEGEMYLRYAMEESAAPDEQYSMSWWRGLQWMVKGANGER
jgi:hypothetical protein